MIKDFLKEKQQEALEKISPETYVCEECVPTAVFHGKEDTLVPIKHTYNFIRLLNENGVKNDFLIFENSGHALDKDPETMQQSKNIIEAYAGMYF